MVVGVVRGDELQHLALGDHRRGARQDLQHLERAVLDHELEGAAEQEIADQHRRLVAPDRVGGGEAAAQVALVDHVVMQQRRGVDELDRGGERDVPRRRDSRTAARVARVSIGRSRLPPAAMIWPASCGISATGLCMRSRMSALTLFEIGRAAGSVRRSSDAGGFASRPRALSTRATRCSYAGRPIATASLDGAATARRA